MRLRFLSAGRGKSCTRRSGIHPPIVIVFILAAVLFPPFRLLPDSGSVLDSGRKYISYFSRKDYRNQSMNWAVLQDKRGLIYVGNHGGLMEYDGVSWREIVVPNISVRTLAMAENGTVYVGGVNEIGFLAPDSRGTLQYQSLTHHLNKNQRGFSYVWRCYSSKKGIYYWTSKYIFLWNFERFTVWDTHRFFDAAFLCGGRLLVRERGTGLLELTGKKPRILPGCERFNNDNIYMAAPLDQGRLLIGTRSNGLFVYDGTGTAPFPTGADEYIKKHQLYFGKRLSSGEYALATRRGGLVIIDNRGTPLHIFNKQTGLPDNSVKHFCQDIRGNIWLALAEGVAKIEYNSPFSLYSETSGLPGRALSVTRHQPGNTLYAGTDKGLFQWNRGRFQPVPRMQESCYHLLSTQNGLLAASTRGVILHNPPRSPEPLDNVCTYVLYRSRFRAGLIYAGTAHGLNTLYFNTQSNRWLQQKKFPAIEKSITEEIRTITEDQQGNLWLGPRTGGVIRVTFPPASKDQSPHIRRYGTGHGLPTGEIHVFHAAGHVIFASQTGLYRFHHQTRAFIPDTVFGSRLSGQPNGRGVFRIVEAPDRHIWIHSQARNICAVPREDGTYQLREKSFLRVPLAQVNSIYPDGVYTWFASHDGLLRFDTRGEKKYENGFATLIRGVTVSGVTVYNGYGSQDKASGRYYPVIPYKDRNLRFQFAAPFFEAQDRTRYQCLLEGYDSRWTDWSPETWKDYTNLDHGFNTFRVRAKNVYGITGKEAVFRFNVLPPWYREWWAYVLYGLAFLFTVFLAVKWRSIYHKKEKQRLETIIHQRTGEIQDKNLQLEEQAEKLKEMDEIKSRFFANISHDFRTPLTLIMGPLEQMAADCPDNRQKKKLEIMLCNAERLLGLINQLLELSKLDSGKIKLAAAPQDLIVFLKGITASFELLAGQSNIDLTFRCPNDSMPVYFDTSRLEEVMCNLLINAIKFTPNGGSIIVAAARCDDRNSRFPSGYARIAVEDTGPGIPPEQLNSIFDRFYQSKDTSTRHSQGSGIGLAIAREFVELHRGAIHVENREEVGGSRFIVRLHLGRDFLKPGEIIEETAPLAQSDAGKPRRVAAIQTRPDTAPVEEPFKTVTGEPDDNGKKDETIILVVEDSAEVRAYIREALEPGYTVIEAADGAQGIEKARDMIPDLVISDIMMPVRDGIELCKELKHNRHTSHIPIILLTARAAEENILEGLESGADDYITKPFNTRILTARIKNLIEIRSQLQQDVKREMTLKPVSTSVSNIDREFLDELQEVITMHALDPEFNVETMGKKLYMSGATVYRKIHALTGESPTEYIKSCRLKRAAQLLANGFGSVTEVAYEVGFRSHSYFTKCFKDRFHMLPSTFMATETKKTGHA